MGQANCFFPVYEGGKENNEEEEEEVEEEEGEEGKEEEKEEEEEEITTPMQSFAPMQHSLLMGLGYRVLHFLVNKLEQEEEEKIDEELAVLCFSRL